MKTLVALSLAATLALSAGQAFAGEDSELVIDGETFVTKLDAPADSPLAEIISGWRFRSDETQKLQTDDSKTRQ